MVTRDPQQVIEQGPTDAGSSLQNATTTQSDFPLINYEKLCDDLSQNIRKEYKLEPASVTVGTDLNNLKAKEKVRLKDYVKRMFDKQYERQVM